MMIDDDENQSGLTRVIIGVQCRSTSTRLPGKALMELGGKTIIQRVMNSCHSASRYISKLPINTYCKTVLLVPTNDVRLISALHSKYEIIDGSEHDVLSRYVRAANKYDADYIVRITGDCVALQPFIISRHIRYAVTHGIDYCTNVIERTCPEGWDTEVISMRLLDWLDKNANTAYHREHVTTYIRDMLETGKSDQWKVACSTDRIDLSNLKTSIDTIDEYRKAVYDYNKLEGKRERIRSIGTAF